MAQTDKLILATCTLWSVAAATMVARPTPELQLILLPLTVVFFVTSFAALIRVFTRWSRARMKSLVPLLACLLAVPVAGLAGVQVRHALFLWSLPSLERVVRQIEAGEIPVTTELRRLDVPHGNVRLAYAMLAQRDSNGVLIVEFLAGKGFPVKHSGYLFISSGVLEPASPAASRWQRRRTIRPNWFRVGD